MDIKIMHLDKDDILMIHGYFTEEGAERVKATLKEIGIKNKVLFAPPDVEMTVVKKGKAEGEAKVGEEIKLESKGMEEQKFEQLETGIELIIRLSESPEEAAKHIVDIFKDVAGKVKVELDALKKAVDKK